MQESQLINGVWVPDIPSYAPLSVATGAKRKLKILLCTSARRSSIIIFGGSRLDRPHLQDTQTLAKPLSALRLLSVNWTLARIAVGSTGERSWPAQQSVV